MAATVRIALDLPDNVLAVLASLPDRECTVQLAGDQLVIDVDLSAARTVTDAAQVDDPAPVPGEDVPGEAPLGDDGEPVTTPPALHLSGDDTAQRPPTLNARVVESDSAGGYAAQNRYSSASGAYQFLDSTWRNVSARAGHPGYAKARHAPPWVQDAVALWTLENIGRSPWRGTGCR